MRFWMMNAALFPFLIAVAGCLSPRGDAPPIHTYQLTLDAWSGETRPLDAAGPVLLVSQPQSHPGYETPRMIYLKRPYELEFFAVNQWADAPARLFAPLLIQALGQTGPWRAVIFLPSSVRGDYRLDSSGFAVQQEFFQPPSRVRVLLRAQFVDLKESRVLSTRTFEAEEPAPSEDAYGGVVAANKATAAILTQLTSWLHDCLRGGPECKG